MLALLGRNGAGKTSTLRTIARVPSPELKQGEIWLQGKALHHMEGYQAAQAGIQLVPEDRRIISGLTVEENLMLAQVAEPRGWELERIYEHFPRLAERRTQEGDDALRRRAADAGRCPRARPRSEAAAARRAL